MAAIQESVVAAVERYASPASLAQAAQILAEGEASLFAGGTDLMVAVNAGTAQLAPTLMNLRRIPELAGIAVEDERLRLGATATVTQVLESALIAETAPVLARAADRFASVQIRNAATLGGNVCNASPAGDMILPLLVLGAEAELASWQDGKLASRRVALAEFFTGPGQSVRRPGEILVALWCDLPPAGFVAGFEKSGPRPALEIAVVAACLSGVRTGGGLVDVRLAFGAVAPTPMLAPATAGVIEGRSLDEQTIAEAARTASEEVRPISDLRGSDWYRRHLAGVMTKRLLENVATL